jgi:hypothetical protein
VVVMLGEQAPGRSQRTNGNGQYLSKRNADLSRWPVCARKPQRPLHPLAGAGAGRETILLMVDTVRPGEVSPEADR